MRGVLLLAAVMLVAIIVSRALNMWRRTVAMPGRTPRNELVKDPVCQTYVVLSRAVTTEVNGTVVHFCSRECAARFARGERHA